MRQTYRGPGSWKSTYLVAALILEIYIQWWQPGTCCVGSWFLRFVFRRSGLSSGGSTYFRGRLVLGNTITCRCGRHAVASAPTVNQSTRRPDATYTSKNQAGRDGRNNFQDNAYTSKKPGAATVGGTSQTMVGTMAATAGTLPKPDAT